MALIRGGNLEFILENKLSDKQYHIIRDHACKTWNWSRSQLEDPINKYLVDTIVFRRHDAAIKYFIPWMLNLIGEKKATRIVDFGCGSGSSSVAMSHYFNEIIGMDILEEDILAARVRADVLCAKNCVFVHSSPSEIVEKAIEYSPNVIVLYSVVEHLLESEKIDYLKTFWRFLPPGGKLFIHETPNRYAYSDEHTMQIPFAHLLPDEIALQYIDRSPRLEFADQLKKVFTEGGWEAYSEKRHRAGLGVGFHEFEIAFEEDLNEILIGDGFDAGIIQSFPISVDDHSLLSYFDAKKLPIPAGFARSVLSLAFEKPKSEKCRSINRENNKRRSEVAIRTHSYTSAIRAYESRL
uniref:Ubiquinone/menaquinone biosynthesis C-methylase UbiE n=1 Tax=Candidatus Kentrum sp. LPFa TaxID=2126335 RepID=A0A450W3X7_9GAMM|nr:MAG: Ubiquinone/menaquinone biosynthesis C-methylase UbiE [Candidatus Kentron sp. LPFa]